MAEHSKTWRPVRLEYPHSRERLVERVVQERINYLKRLNVQTTWHQIARLKTQVEQEILEASKVDSLPEWIAKNDPAAQVPEAPPSGWDAIKNVRAEMGTAAADSMRELIDNTNAKIDEQTRAELNAQEQQAQEMMLRVLSWCVIRMGGEIVIPRAVLEGHQYVFESRVDENDRLHITAEEVGGEDAEHKSSDGDLPY